MAWKYITDAIIAVIILLIFVPMMFTSAGNVWNLLAEKLGLISYSPVEKAVLCSYYRCVKGCDAPETLEYCSDLAEACSLPLSFHVDDSGKVCGWAAAQFPVAIELKGNAEVDKEKLKNKIGIDCVATDDTGGNIDWWEFLQPWKHIGWQWEKVNLLYIPSSSLTKVTRETCPLPGTVVLKLENAVKYAQTKEGTHYAYTLDNSICFLWGVLGCKPMHITFVTASKEYVTVSSSESLMQQVYRNMFLRIIVKDEKEEDTPQGEYLLTLKELGEDNGKNWCILNVSNVTTSYSKLLILNEYPQFCLQTYRGWYLCFKLESMNKDEGNANITISYVKSEPSGYTSPPDVSASCETACENSLPSGLQLSSSYCSDSCAFEGEAGNGWCKVMESKQYCCCEYTGP